MKFVRLKDKNGKPATPVTEARSVFLEDGTSLEEKLNSGDIISTTWAELKALRDNGELAPGKQYRITDYDCTTTQENTQSAHHPFDIIVTADSETTLNENARACLHEGDTYFKDCNLNAWELKYSLDNDTERFAWAQKGGIESMPTYGSWANGTPLKRCPEFDGANEYARERGYYFAWGTNADMEDGDPGDFVYSEIEYPMPSDEVYNAYDAEIQIVPPLGHGVVFYMKDEWNNECPYDFKNVMFKRYYDEDFGAYKKGGNPNNKWCYTFCMLDFYDNKAHDVSVEQFKYLSDNYVYYNQHGNVILPWFGEYNGRDGKGAFVLNDIVFVTDTDSCCVARDYSYGEFSGFYSNTFGYGCYNNTFGNGCYNNTFGDDCYSNTFGFDCFSNTFGFDCFSNTFGYGCDDNTFGNYCYFNTFGNYCYFNTFGNGCNNNILGSYCNHNTFRNGCYFNKFLKNFMRHIVLENGVQYVNVTCSATTSSSKLAQNARICSGVFGKSSAPKTCTLATAGNNFLTIFSQDSTGTLVSRVEGEVVDLSSDQAIEGKKDFLDISEFYAGIVVKDVHLDVSIIDEEEQLAHMYLEGTDYYQTIAVERDPVQDLEVATKQYVDALGAKVDELYEDYQTANSLL